MFAYCANNPIMNVDPTGCGFWSGLKSFFSFVANCILSAFGFGDLASAISGGLTVSRVNNKAIKVQNDRRTHSENVYNTYRNSGYQPKKLSYHQDNAMDYAEYVKHCKALADDLQYTDLFNEYFANTFEELSENEQQAIVDDMIEWDTEMYNKLRCKFATDSFNDVVDYALP